MALILIVFLTITFGVLDLGVGVFRYHVISQGARYAARRAIVHGELADRLTPWGPGTIDVMADASGVPVVDGPRDGVRDKLIGCDLSRTNILVEWLEGTNELEAPVRVTITTPYQPVLLFIFPNQEYTLTATSTMQIAH